ncbi:PRTRC system protein F [Undibacterium sp. Jales W-56]|uniref:PRTRC system protein F n=1 Tax=Undibacterium sp. Jales W-56 TaxID=2897325 RepID=UPI0021D3B911|nr:PRTRC system protein F [Undibacterium sp. Jales W-56]MCU6435236.1 PRTRC system protein F [Undibacterium sp. Jales W-56]
MNGAVFALALPRLAGAVPLTVVPPRLATANASIARFLIQAGAIREGDVPEKWDDAIEVCQGALDAWLKRELGPLHCLEPVFTLTASSGSDGSSMPRKGACDPASIRYSSVELVWYENNLQQWPVGAALEALERAFPGLGQAALDILRRQSRFVYPLFTPDLACDVASYVYWCGEDDEEAALDMEAGDDVEAREAMRDEMVTRRKLDEAFPAWSTAIPTKQSKSLPLAAIERLSGNLHDSVMRDIAANALGLARMRIKDAFSPAVEGEFLGWGAVLSWREDDLTVRVYDDLVQLAYQSEFCDRIGEIDMALDAPQAMCSWQRAMRQRFKAIRLIDRLIHLLAGGNWQ